MNILILGSIRYNSDRILALKNAGHNLYYGYRSFTQHIISLDEKITCIPLARRQLVDQVKYLIAKHHIEIIYCLLNVYDGSSEIIVELLDNNLQFPIVRHYKEHYCTPSVDERRSLIETDGQIYINDQSYEYFRDLYGVSEWSSHILDADMIAEKYMTNDFSTKISEESNRPHILIAGSMTATNDSHDMRLFCEEMNKRQVHVHLYGKYIHIDNNRHITAVQHTSTKRVYERMAFELPYIHLHDFIEPLNFTRIWSQYDVGAMHLQTNVASNLARFERMNYPYRYSSYLAAGLPLLVKSGCYDALEELVRRENIGITFDTYDTLVEKLTDRKLMAEITQNCILNRSKFSFDQQVPKLVEIFHKYMR